MAEAAREAVEALLEVAGLDLGVEVLQGDGQLEIELSGAGQQELIADRGSLLLAIQHLLPRTIRGLTGRSVPCRVDSGNFHRMQEESLERLARKTAEEVKQEQVPVSLDPMNPAERRIIHLSLADDDEVVTESQGRGFFKRVSIRPAKLRPRGFDRYNR
jgi:spoIIIJ-associated protein